MAEVAIVILNWNGVMHLKEFLPSVTAYCPEYARVFVADNGSTDDSISFLENNYPNITVITLNKNYGYTGGYNRALAQIDARYHILLNSDIEVTPGWVDPLFKLMENDLSVGACQPKIRSLLNKEQFEYAGASGGFIDWLGYPFCRGRIFDSIEEDMGQYNDPVEIFWATGACLMVRANDFRIAGGLDETFFAHMEEIDLCWRLKRLGRKIMVCPYSEVYHLGGGTLHKSNPGKTYLNFRNNLLLLAKNTSPKTFRTVIISRLFLDSIAVLKFMASGAFRDGFAVLKAYKYFFKNFHKFRKNSPKDNSATIPGIYQRSIVIEYFLKRTRRYSQLRQEYFTL